MQDMTLIDNKEASLKVKEKRLIESASECNNKNIKYADVESMRV